MLRIVIIFFCTVLALNLYINRTEEYIPVASAAPHSVQTFNHTVEIWAQEISAITPDVQVSPTVAGNCLPVAMVLQNWIIATGRRAFIVAIMPDDMDTGHAVVMYPSEIYGDLDSVIDNGYSTNFNVRPSADLFNGTMGEYVGICDNPNPTTGTCSVTLAEE